MGEMRNIVKAKLAQQFPHDIFGYMAGKDSFIKETLRKAHEWRSRQTDTDGE